MQICSILLAVLSSSGVCGARIPWQVSNPNEEGVGQRFENTTIPDVRGKLESSTIVPAPNNVKEQYSDNSDLSISDYSFSRKINKDSDTDSSFVQEDDQQLTDINGSDDEGETPISDYSSSEAGEKPVYNSNGSDEEGEQPIFETNSDEEVEKQVSNEQLVPDAISSDEVVNETSTNANRTADVSDQQGSDVSSSYNGSSEFNPDDISFGEAYGKPGSNSNSSAEGSYEITSDTNRSANGGDLLDSDSSSSSKGDIPDSSVSAGVSEQPVFEMSSSEEVDNNSSGGRNKHPIIPNNPSGYGTNRPVPVTTSVVNVLSGHGSSPPSYKENPLVPRPVATRVVNIHSGHESSPSSYKENRPVPQAVATRVVNVHSAQGSSPSLYKENQPVSQPVSTRVVNVLLGHRSSPSDKENRPVPQLFPTGVVNVQSGYRSSPSSNKRNRPVRVKPPKRPTRKQIQEPSKSKMIEGLNTGLHTLLEAIRKNRAYLGPAQDQLFQQVRKFTQIIKWNGGEVDERNKRLMEYLLPQHLKEALGF